MSFVTASGREINETCDAFTSSIVEPARSATDRCDPGVIVLSSVPTSAHEGIVLHARLCGLRACRSEGRAVTAVVFERWPANASRNAS
jgi:hypothetical protein